MNNLDYYINFVSTCSDLITDNTLENILNHLETLTNEQKTELHNLNALILQAEKIERQTIKEKLVNKLVNQIEIFASQL